MLPRIKTKHNLALDLNLQFQVVCTCAQGTQVDLNKNYFFFFRRLNLAFISGPGGTLESVHAMDSSLSWTLSSFSWVEMLKAACTVPSMLISSASLASSVQTCLRQTKGCNFHVICIAFKSSLLINYVPVLIVVSFLSRYLITT